MKSIQLYAICGQNVSGTPLTPCRCFFVALYPNY